MTSWLIERPLAHRGLHDLERGIPENSLAAFAAAVAVGAPVELDVHLARDGVPVVVHDHRLGRLTGRDVAVDDLTAAELGGLGLLGTDHTIPTLGDVLAHIAGRIGVMVEIKNYGREVGSLEAAVAAVLDDDAGPVCVASFNPRTIGWFREHRPQTLRGQASGTFSDVPLPRWLVRPMRSLASNRWTHPHFLSYELAGLPNDAVDRWRARGLPLITWTVATPEEAERARRLADNFIFEHLDGEHLEP